MAEPVSFRGLVGTDLLEAIMRHSVFVRTENDVPSEERERHLANRRYIAEVIRGGRGGITARELYQLIASSMRRQGLELYEAFASGQVQGIESTYVNRALVHYAVALAKLDRRVFSQFPRWQSPPPLPLTNGRPELYPWSALRSFLTVDGMLDPELDRQCQELLAELPPP